MSAFLMLEMDLEYREYSMEFGMHWISKRRKLLPNDIIAGYNLSLTFIRLVIELRGIVLPPILCQGRVAIYCCCSLW